MCRASSNPKYRHEPIERRLVAMEVWSPTNRSSKPCQICKKPTTVLDVTLNQYATYSWQIAKFRMGRSFVGSTYQDQMDVAVLVPYQQMCYVACRRPDLSAVRTSDTDPCTVVSMEQQDTLTRQTVLSRYRRGYRHSNEIWMRVHARSSS